MSEFDEDLSKFEYESYGYKVEDFSSEYARENTASYSVRNLPGRYEIYPRYGDFTQACVLVSVRSFDIHSSLTIISLCINQWV